MGLFGGISLGGLFGGGDIKDKLLGSGTGQYRAGLTRIINQARDANRLSGDRALTQLQTGLGAELKGYDEAIAKTSGISRSARRETVTRSGTAEAGLVNKYGQSGRFGTTALDNARMGLHSTLSRDLESIDSNFAGLFAQLSTGKGRAEAGGRAGIASLEVGQGMRESQLIQLLASALKKPTPGMLSDVLGLIGAGVGSAYGGQFGGAVGGEAGNQLGGLFERS